jgi:transcriptional regulator with XRE-family HTH domain
MDIHERIRERRKQLGITSFEKMAERIFEKSGKRISWQTIQLWEKKGGTAPSRNNLPNLAKALECSPEWILTGLPAPVDDGDLPQRRDHPENPMETRMILQYVTPKENELLELFRLCYDDGREDIIEFAEGVEKRPLVRVARVDNSQV